MNKENAIEIRNMSKQFKRVFDKPTTLKERLIFWSREKPEWHQVLKCINLDIRKGDTVALIGTNGSGKSTLLKLMTKILYANTGTIEVSGKLASLLELGAGFHPDFTGRENIYFNASIFGLTKAEIDNRVDEIIEFSELGSFIDNPVRTYSSGMYMRLAFSVAINVDAEILLIDEILSVGDQHFQDKCYAKLKELRDSEKTIVIVSHSLDMVQKICKRAIWIYKGEVKKDGNPKEVIEEYLEQVVLDHENVNQNKEFTKQECILTIESPLKGQKFHGVSSLEVIGWEVSNVMDTVVQVCLANQSIVEATRYKRADVLMHYQEACGGASYNRQAGWKCELNTTGLTGNQLIKVQVVDARYDVVLSEDEINITID